MKTLLLLFILALASCTARNLPPDTQVAEWKGKDMLIIISDSLGSQTYESIYLKHE